MKYTLKHHLISENHHFDSWMSLCEFVVERAIEISTDAFKNEIVEVANRLADEIIDTAEEVAWE